MRFYFALLACLLPGATTAVGQERHPSIKFEFLFKDYGTVAQGELIKQIFPFANKGTGVLKILSVGKTCSCEAALLSAKEIPPGQSGRIEMAVDTGNFDGSIEKFIYVHTNDPKNPDIILSIKAVVEPEIIPSDLIIFFGSAPRGEQITKEITLTIPPGKSVKILSVRSDDSNVTVRLDPAPGSDVAQYRLIAVQKASAKPGDHYGNIIIKTNSRFLPEIMIPERGTVGVPGKAP